MDATTTLALALAALYEGTEPRDDDPEFNAATLALCTLANEVHRLRKPTGTTTAPTGTTTAPTYPRTVTSPTVGGTPVHIVGAEFDGDDL